MNSMISQHILAWDCVMLLLERCSYTMYHDIRRVCVSEGGGYPQHTQHIY